MKELDNKYESGHISLSEVNGKEKRMRVREQETPEGRLKSYLCDHKGRYTQIYIIACNIKSSRRLLKRFKAPYHYCPTHVDTGNSPKRIQFKIKGRCVYSGEVRVGVNVLSG